MSFTKALGFPRDIDMDDIRVTQPRGQIVLTVGADKIVVAADGIYLSSGLTKSSSAQSGSRRGRSRGKSPINLRGSKPERRDREESRSRGRSQSRNAPRRSESRSRGLDEQAVVRIFKQLMAPKTDAAATDDAPVPLQKKVAPAGTKYPPFTLEERAAAITTIGERFANDDVYVRNTMLAMRKAAEAEARTIGPLVTQRPQTPTASGGTPAVAQAMSGPAIAPVTQQAVPVATAPSLLPASVPVQVGTAPVAAMIPSASVSTSAVFQIV